MYNSTWLCDYCVYRRSLALPVIYAELYNGRNARHLMEIYTECVYRIDIVFLVVLVRAV